MKVLVSMTICLSLAASASQQPPPTGEPAQPTASQPSTTQKADSAEAPPVAEAAAPPVEKDTQAKPQTKTPRAPLWTGAPLIADSAREAPPGRQINRPTAVSGLRSGRLHLPGRSPWHLGLRNRDGSYDILNARTGRTRFGFRNADGSQDLLNPLTGRWLMGLGNRNGTIDYFNPRTGRWNLGIGLGGDRPAKADTRANRAPAAVAPRQVAPHRTTDPSQASPGPARRAARRQPTRHVPARRAGGG